MPRGARPGSAAGQAVAALTANGVGAGGGVDDNAAQAGHITVIDLAQITSPDNRSNPQPGDPAPSLAATSRPITFNHIQDPIHSGDMASSLTTDGLGVITGGLAVRRLTPRECERLMSWPDDWTRWRDDGTEIPDSHRYRFCGNGVVSNCTEWIGRRIIAADPERNADDRHPAP